MDLIFDAQVGKRFVPPPLPPRQSECSDNEKTQRSIFKQRCNTLPAKDLSRISQIFTSESDYVVMSPSKVVDKVRKQSITESLYMPMSPVINLKNKIVESVESCYMSMNGKKT